MRRKRGRNEIGGEGARELVPIGPSKIWTSFTQRAVDFQWRFQVVRIWKLRGEGDWEPWEGLTSPVGTVAVVAQERSACL